LSKRANKVDFFLVATVVTNSFEYVNDSLHLEFAREQRVERVLEKLVNSHTLVPRASTICYSNKNLPRIVQNMPVNEELFLYVIYLRILMSSLITIE
jgi:hypothetical protein